MYQGNWSGLNYHVLLGWVVYTVSMKVYPPPHSKDCLLEILAVILASQKCLSVTKWRKVLGNFHSIALNLPVAHFLFSHIQKAFRHVKGNRVTLTHGVQEALAYFQWLATDMDARPMWLYKISPLTLTVDGYHDASELCGDVVLPGTSIVLLVL